MRRLFLRVYVGVALALLVVQVAAILSVRREVVEQADRHVMIALTPAVRMMQHRYLRDGTEPGPPDARFEPPGPEGPRFPGGPGGPGHRGRFLRDIMEHHGIEARIESVAALDLSAADDGRLRSDELVMVRHGQARYLVAPLTGGEALSLGPFPSVDPIRHMWRRVAQSGLFLVAIGAVLVVLLRPFERRLRRLADVAETLGHGDLAARVADPHPDAIGSVARAFDDMAASLARVIDGQRDLLHAVSHELRTPLARLLFLAEELRDVDDPTQRQQVLDRFEASVDDMRELVDELLDFARLQGSDARDSRDAVSLRPLLEACVTRAGELRGGLEVRLLDGPNPTVHVSARQLRRALDNVLANAVRHAASAVTVELRDGGGGIEFVVDDDGPGIPAPDRERVFEPFVRLDPSRSRAQGGAGLGLAIVRRVMEAHGGTASVGNHPGRGARIILRLPVYPDGSEVSGETPAGSPDRSA